MHACQSQGHRQPASWHCSLLHTRPVMHTAHRQLTLPARWLGHKNPCTPQALTLSSKNSAASGSDSTAGPRRSWCAASVRNFSICTRHAFKKALIGGSALQCCLAAGWWAALGAHLAGVDVLAPCLLALERRTHCCERWRCWRGLCTVVRRR